MSSEYIDLVILANGQALRAPGFSGVQPREIVMAQESIYDVLEVVTVPVSEALMTLARVDSVFYSLEYDEYSSGQKEKAD